MADGAQRARAAGAGICSVFVLKPFSPFFSVGYPEFYACNIKNIPLEKIFSCCDFKKIPSFQVAPAFKVLDFSSFCAIFSTNAPVAQVDRAPDS